MTVRWPVIASLAALLVGAGLAAIVLAFCGETGSESGLTQRATRTPFSRTVTRTASAGTPMATGTPAGTPPALTPTPPVGPSPEDTPEVPPSPPSGPEPTTTPIETPPASPTQLTETTTPGPTMPTPVSTATRTPLPALPDLVILGMSVSNDRLAVILGNKGAGRLQAGQEVEFLIRGVMAETVTLSEALLPGASVGLVFENQVIYEPELVLVVVDPNGAIPEENNANNDMVKQLAPDVAPDLAVHDVFRAVDTQRLKVLVRNPTGAPATQATVVVTVYLGGATDPTTPPREYLVSIEPHGFETVDIIGVIALPGTEVRVVVEMTDPPDANPANNVWEGTIS